MLDGGGQCHKKAELDNARFLRSGALCRPITIISFLPKQRRDIKRKDNGARLLSYPLWRILSSKPLSTQTQTVNHHSLSFTPLYKSYFPSPTLHILILKGRRETPGYLPVRLTFFMKITPNMITWERKGCYREGGGSTLTISLTVKYTSFLRDPQLLVN